MDARPSRLARIPLHNLIVKEMMMEGWVKDPPNRLGPRPRCLSNRLELDALLLDNLMVPRHILGSRTIHGGHSHRLLSAPMAPLDSKTLRKSYG